MEADNERQVLHDTSLTLSAQCRIWGDEETYNGRPFSFGPDLSEAQHAVLRRDNYACRYCGFSSLSNCVDHINDNHRDDRPENMQTVDPLCHGWHHLAELSADDASLAYLPGLSGEDANHLQRTIAMALQSDDDALRSDALDILNWLGSHRDYVKQAWGTWRPATFAAAITRLSAEQQPSRAIVFEHMALVYHPACFMELTRAWSAEAYAQYPTQAWDQVLHDVMHTPD
jgi:uncharacterized protein YbdZ (MbtH family)